ncbi:MAG TPA: RnfABCDGE type electron transport complex subunit A [Chitinispirillaceae bacterium]|jgi:electron transport complex protein RnfA|nr:RnfABCDGE type electron transport complex subunit A [Chitinispirillaceae bacterium]
MESITSLIGISIGAVLINNFVLSRFLGLCPFFGVSKKLSSAIGMGMAVIFVMAMASSFTWVINSYILVKFGVDYLQTIVFILVIAALVQLVEMALQKYSPALYEALGIYLPLITTNCAVLGVAIINTGVNQLTGNPYSFIESLVNGVTSGVGFMLALILMAGIREKLELANVPKAMEGLPITFITAGLMAMAFLGFAGLNFFK